MSYECYHREALHEHVCPVSITEPLVRLRAGLGVGEVAGGVVTALPATALVHVGAVLRDGVRAALAGGGVQTLHGLVRAAGEREVQAVHPTIG